MAITASGRTPSAFHGFRKRETSAVWPDAARLATSVSVQLVVRSTGSEAPEVRNFTLVCQLRAQLETTDAGRHSSRDDRDQYRDKSGVDRAYRDTPHSSDAGVFSYRLFRRDVVDGSGLLEDGRNDVG